MKKFPGTLFFAFIFFSFLVIPTTTIGQMDEQLQKWLALDGRLIIDLPGDWRPLKFEEVEGPFSNANAPLVGLCREDGQGSLRFILYEDSQWPDDARAFQKSLVNTCAEAGLELVSPESFLINGRAFAIALGSYQQSSGVMSTLVGATSLSGRPLLILFAAKGPKKEDILFQEQLALSTVVINEEGIVSEDVTPGVKVLAPLPPSSRAENDVESLPQTDQLLGQRYIPGTGVTLMVPADYKQALLMPGFVAPGGHTSLYVVHSALPYHLARAQVDRKTLHRLGGTLKDSQQVEIDGRPGDLVLATYDSEEGPLNEWILLTGNKDRSLAIHGWYEQEPLGQGKSRMRSILMSMKWDPEVESNSLKGLGFSFSETQNLKMICRAHNNIVMGTSGRSVPISRSETFLLIGSYGSAGPVETWDRFAKEWAERSLLVSELEIESGKEMLVGGQPGYVITGTITDTLIGKKRDYYLAVTVHEGIAYMVEGLQAPYAEKDFFGDFGQVAGSLQFR